MALVKSVYPSRLVDITIDRFKVVVPMSFVFVWPCGFFPASILYKSIAVRYRPVSYPDGPITDRYRFIKNASWVMRVLWLCLVRCLLNSFDDSLLAFWLPHWGKRSWLLCFSLVCGLCYSLLFFIFVSLVSYVVWFVLNIFYTILNFSDGYFVGYFGMIDPSMSNSNVTWRVSMIPRLRVLFRGVFVCFLELTFIKLAIDLIVSVYEQCRSMKQYSSPYPSHTPKVVWIK